jgi:class 3 adenylate cyclase/tetratricopeptide (TPR) repeat protein
MTCPRCGSDVGQGAKFCPDCGASLQANAAEERKLVSVLFVDVVGSTARADGADPEDVRDLNRLFFDAARSTIERHGGVVEKYVGDAVMAVFGAPLARSDDAERAVRAARGVLAAVEDLNARRRGLDLHVRAAVTTGEAIVAVHPAPGEALASGDVVNTAARLQSVAPPDGVVVDAETHALIRHLFHLDELPTVEAKGKQVPLRTWLAREPIAGIATRPTSRTPLVGRERELLLIRAVWQRAVSAGRPHLVSILGPAGIGKSRLAREVSAEIEREGRALWGRSLPYEELTPYHAIGQIVGGVAGIYDNDPPETAREKLARSVGSMFATSDATEVTRYLSLLLGLGLDEPTDDAIHLLYATRRWVERLAAQRPLLVVFEDVHWADDALLDLVAYLVTHVTDQPVVFLALARPEFLEYRPTWGAGMIGQTTIPLQSLLPSEATDVVASLLPDASPETMERVVETAGGNPLFLEELVASLRDVAHARGELPTTVRAAISARVDALSPDIRSVLLQASVIGRTFWEGVLKEIGDLRDVPAALDQLEARGFVLRRPRSEVAGDAEFAFKHQLVREVAYETLSRATRRQLHGETARVIESRVADTGTLAWILAHHWREAGDAGRAVEYFLKAADRARDALLVDDTYENFTRALELAANYDERRRIRLRRGLALAELEDYARADRELAEVLPELDGADEIKALIARGHSTYWTEQPEETLAAAERAVALAEERGPDELRGPAIALLAHAFNMRGRDGDLDRSLELGDRALEVWVPETRLLDLSEHYHTHANANYWTGDYERTFSFSKLAAEMGAVDPHGGEALLRGAGLNGLALSGLGRYEEAIEATDRAIALAREMGRSTNVVTNYSTTPLREVFASEEARRRSDEVASALGPSDFNMPWMNARADLISAHVLLGEFSDAEQMWPGVWDDALASVAWERWLLGGRLAALRAQLEFERKRYDDALAWARRSLEMAISTRRRKYQVVSRITVGRALVVQGLADAALPELHVAVEQADALGSPLFRWQSRASLGEAQKGSSDERAEAEATVKEAVAIVHEVADSLSPERSAAYLDAPQVVRVAELAG